jgi:hypothetical protein
MDSLSRRVVQERINALLEDGFQARGALEEDLAARLGGLALDRESSDAAAGAITSRTIGIGVAVRAFALRIKRRVLDLARPVRARVREERSS